MRVLSCQIKLETVLCDFTLHCEVPSWRLKITKLSGQEPGKPSNQDSETAPLAVNWVSQIAAHNLYFTFVPLNQAYEQKRRFTGFT